MRTPRSAHVSLGSSLLLLAGCGSPPPLSTFDRARIDSASADWRRAALAGDHGALGATYTEDAVLLPPNALQVTGRAGIEEFFRSMPKIVVMELEHVDVEGRDDLAYVQGRYRMTLQVPGVPTPVEDRGKYLEIWRRGADGRWRIARDMFSSDLPVAK
jgi:uncharacterized protein (TIGR02246 family)